MTIVTKLWLGVNTTVIGMGIVFLVLIFLSLIVWIQSKLVAAFSKGMAAANGAAEPEKARASVVAGPGGEPEQVIEKTGIVSGETVLTGIDDEETAALIMAVVSYHANIPLSKLRFKSIKAI